MVISCKRGDDFKHHLFIDAELAGLLIADDEPSRSRGRAIVLHELAHVIDYNRIALYIPVCRFSDGLEEWLFVLTNATWSEYFACHVTAFIDESLDEYLELLLNALDSVPESIRGEIIAYRTHHDLHRLVDFVQERTRLLFKFAGYALGHLDGRGLSLSDVRPQVWTRVQAAGFAASWIALQQALKAMFDESEWSGLSIYDGLGDCALSFLAERGMFFERQGQGFNVNIPFTRETMPTGVQC